MDERERKRLTAEKARFIMERRKRRKKGLPVLPLPPHLQLPTGSLENPQASTSATARQEMADEIAEAHNEPTERLTENREASAPVTNKPVPSTSRAIDDPVPSTSRGTKEAVPSTSRATEDPVPSTSGTASARQDTRNKVAIEKWRDFFEKKQQNDQVKKSLAHRYLNYGEYTKSARHYTIAPCASSTKVGWHHPISIQTKLLS